MSDIVTVLVPVDLSTLPMSEAKKASIKARIVNRARTAFGMDAEIEVAATMRPIGTKIAIATFHLKRVVE